MNKTFRRSALFAIVVLMGVSFTDQVFFKKKTVEDEVIEYEERVKKIVKKRRPASVVEVYESIPKSALTHIPEQAKDSQCSAPLRMRTVVSSS